MGCQQTEIKGFSVVNEDEIIRGSNDFANRALQIDI